MYFIYMKPISVLFANNTLIRDLVLKRMYSVLKLEDGEVRS